MNMKTTIFAYATASLVCLCFTARATPITYEFILPNWDTGYGNVSQFGSNGILDVTLNNGANSSLNQIYLNSEITQVTLKAAGGGAFNQTWSGSQLSLQQNISYFSTNSTGTPTLNLAPLNTYNLANRAVLGMNASGQGFQLANPNPTNGTSGSFWPISVWNDFYNWVAISTSVNVNGPYPYNGLGLRLDGQQISVNTSPPTFSTLAKLANDAYGNNLGTDGYSVTKLVNDATSGFAANVYKNSSTNQVVISVRGTDLNDSIDTLTYNLLADASFEKDGAANSLLLSYVQQLAILIKSVHDVDPNAAITLTGHSLGGAVAQIVGNAAGVGVVSFDAPGAKNALTFTENQDFLAGLNGYVFNTPTTNITNIRLQGDEVSLVGKPVFAGSDSQFGTTVSVPNSNPNFNVWNISGNHKMATLQKQVEAYCPVSAAGCT